MNTINKLKAALVGAFGLTVIQGDKAKETTVEDEVPPLSCEGYKYERPDQESVKETN